MIKRLSKKYLSELVNLNVSAFEPLEGILGKMDRKGIREYFEISFRKGKVFGYFIDKKLVGCIGYVLGHDGKFVDIEHVLLKPDFHGKGIGKEMIVFLEDFVRKNHKNVKEFRLTVRCKNSHAVEFYEHGGYFRHAYLMKKKI
jgi:GNAT superfamily N-acetyltransferase